MTAKYWDMDPKEVAKRRAAVLEQARWEVELERFEQEVEKEKARIRAKRAWFPWRIKIERV